MFSTKDSDLYDQQNHELSNHEDEFLNESSGSLHEESKFAKNVPSKIKQGKKNKKSKKQ